MTDESENQRARDAYRALDQLSSGYMPTESDLSSAPLIEDWVFVRVDGVVMLVGRVTGHPTLKSDKLKRTSALLAIDEKAGWALTYSRYYRLGARYSKEK
ncbi:DUF6634 family protein [Rhodoblastus sp.]|uniref:DUF6634 family protein n=1 Tax=Rhodoblastus sp. TaxID=1962975 RepID=UPI0025DC8D41|nr:DUF6634 family protein [Rhodoblastus sp.]